MKTDNHMNKFPFTMCENSEPAKWIIEAIPRFAGNVISVVPKGFEAYARIFHPAYLSTFNEQIPLRWAEVAKQCGKVSHSTMQWRNIYCHDIYDAAPNREMGARSIQIPHEGSLTKDIAEPLWKLLDNYSKTQNCYFGIWEGYGHHGEILEQTPTFGTDMLGRKYHLFKGRISAIEGSFSPLFRSTPLQLTSFEFPIPSLFGSLTFEIPNSFSKKPKYEPSKLDKLIRNIPSTEWLFYQSANLWWPEDNAWCVASEIDFVTTYIGASQEIIDAIVSDKNLEAYQVEPTDDVTNTSDTINPLPPRERY